MAALSASERSAGLRSLWAPGLATLVCLAILLGLGVWRLARKGEKEALIARIIERAKSTRRILSEDELHALVAAHDPHIEPETDHASDALVTNVPMGREMDAEATVN